MELTKDRIGDISIMVLQGHYLDLSNAEALVSNLQALVQDDRRVLFDMSGVEFVDSAGLGALMACRRHLLADGIDLTLYGLTPKVRGVFEVARMHRLFSIAETQEQALNIS